MKVLIDTDVLLDVALATQPFLTTSQRVLDWAEIHPGDAAIAWHSISNIAYLLKPNPRRFLLELLRFVDVATVSTAQAKMALSMQISDLEDAMQVAAALAFGADHIVTRNYKDYRNAPISVVSPAEYLRTATRVR